MLVNVMVLCVGKLGKKWETDIGVPPKKMVGFDGIWKVVNSVLKVMILVVVVLVLVNIY